jgi:hypothetical protein
LTREIVALASEYGRYGYRRITALLRDRGWKLGKDRVQRSWRREGLKVPQKQRPRGGMPTAQMRGCLAEFNAIHAHRKGEPLGSRLRSHSSPPRWVRFNKAGAAISATDRLGLAFPKASLHPLPGAVTTARPLAGAPIERRPDAQIAPSVLASADLPEGVEKHSGPCRRG